MTRQLSRPAKSCNAAADGAAGLAAGQCRVVVGVDDTAAGIAALRQALELAASADAPLVAVRAWDLGLPRHGGLRHHRRQHSHVVLFLQDDVPRMRATQLARKALRTAGGALPAVPLAIMIPRGEPGAVLTSLTTASDVPVVGASTGHSLRHVIHGSVSSYCRRHANCPVVAVSGRQRREAGYAGTHR